MSLTPQPTQSAVFTALRSALLAIVPVGVEVLQGLQNRVPEPVGADFVIMTMLGEKRLATNVDTYADCAFTASISGMALTVSAVQFGAVTVGNEVFGVGLPYGVTIIAQTSGTPGDVGVYTLSAAQMASPGTFACGTVALLQSMQIDFQLDVHGPNATDNARTISTLFRDEFATRLFGNFANGIAPISADDPKLVPFQNGEQQYEFRMVIDLALSVNVLVTAPQQFAGALKVSPIIIADALPG